MRNTCAKFHHNWPSRYEEIDPHEQTKTQTNRLTDKAKTIPSDFCGDNHSYYSRVNINQPFLTTAVTKCDLILQPAL